MIKAPSHGPKGSLSVEQLIVIGSDYLGIYNGLSTDRYRWANLLRQLMRLSWQGNLSVAVEPRLLMERKGVFAVERLQADPQVSLTVGQRLS